jgi:hypothetical protein
MKKSRYSEAQIVSILKEAAVVCLYLNCAGRME